MGLVTGTCFFRDLGATHRDKKLFLLMGQLWVPATVDLKEEHLYKAVGSEYHVGEAELLTAIGVQVLLNSAKDISGDTKKKHPSQIVSYLHMPHP